MKRTWHLVAVATLFLVSCATQTSPGPTAARLTETLPPPAIAEPTATEEAPAATPAITPPPTTEEAPEVPQADYPGLSLPEDRGDFFAGSGVCAVCHTQMVDEAGADVSIDSDWRSSMMANAARDPYWQASVRGEVLSNPDYQEIIEDTCATCHMPMARYTGATAGVSGQVLDEGLANPEHPLHPLAMDGVSCALCHQIRPDGFGEHESFHGGYAIDAELPPEQREAFGPYHVGMGMMQIMQSASGFIPMQAMHVEQAELCATCHTVYTPFVDASGQVAGEFPEQVPYLEWEASSFSERMSCQRCHMPAAQGGVQISLVGGHHLRSPFYQHIVVGGNAYMLDMLAAFAEELAVTASSAQFENKQGQTLKQLQGHTATIDLEGISSDGSTLTTEVVVRTMTGHKFPTAYPSRRAWIHLAVQDASGNVLFESGAVNLDGSIAGNDNDADPSSYEAHYLSIDSPEQVQIYEAIMGNTEGQPTTTLLAGATYLKDNRLLPAGFDKSAVQPDIAVYGAVVDDADFESAMDRTQYTIALDSVQWPLTVTAELLYQTIGYRWADNLRQHDAPEPARFLDYYEQMPNQAVVVACTTAEITE
jgi:hypothetical protein